MATGPLVFLVDVAEQAMLAATKLAMHKFGTSLCLQQQREHQDASGPVALPTTPVLGLCNLAKPAQAAKPVLQVRLRPGPFVLRDFHAAVGRLVHAAPDGSCGAFSGATAAAALQQLVGVMAQDAACAAAGGRRSVLYLTDRVEYDAEDFAGCLEVGVGSMHDVGAGKLFA